MFMPFGYGKQGSTVIQQNGIPSAKIGNGATGIPSAKIAVVQWYSICKDRQWCNVISSAKIGSVQWYSICNIGSGAMAFPSAKIGNGKWYSICKDRLARALANRPYGHCYENKKGKGGLTRRISCLSFAAGGRQLCLENAEADKASVYFKLSLSVILHVGHPFTIQICVAFRRADRIAFQSEVGKAWESRD
ncbi:hypothetical protein CEXT_615511 [Caerostris extrusa]|uniref:Uncharacterized protein n=1 Tax=Caerostris extrusa TaxID=172846 RepID=A0AAV4QYW5_CAEEX|nr:hypothetical protein CEXT_615511 [Caerostris extrusa]